MDGSFSRTTIILCLCLLCVSINCETTLYLLNVLPYPDNRTFAGWDRGFELIPAGRLAEEQINNRSDILPGYRLAVLEVKSEACGISNEMEGLVNFYEELVKENHLIVGVTGLFCSSVTNVIAPLTSHPGIDYLTLAASTSHIHRNVARYPRLYHVISSSVVFNEAALKLMQVFGWQRVSLVHDSLGVNFLATVENFLDQVNTSHPYLEIVTREPITFESVSSIYDNLVPDGGRIVYASVTVPEAAKMMCEAYRSGYMWPVFAYIFLERTIDEFLVPVVPCTREQMLQSIEGVFLLQYRLEVKSDTMLESGWTYGEYHTEYIQRLAEYANTTNMELENNDYANSLYDEVWAFVLALNNSLQRLSSQNLSFADYHFGNSTISDIIQKELGNVSFQGATGLIQFDSLGEVRTPVDIFQVRDGEPILVGIYFTSNNVTHIQNVSDVPDDEFGRVFVLIPLWLSLSIFVIVGVFAVLTTINLLVFLYWRNIREIKATSPFLSLLMFAGCYLLYAAAVVRTSYRFKAIGDATLFKVLCNTQIWFGANGLNVIFATVLVRLLRIYHVFKHFGKTSKYWSDRYLFVGAVVLCLIGDIILILWIITDVVHKEVSETYDASANPPHYDILALCNSEYFSIWLIVAFTYAGVLILIVVGLSIATRHVHLPQFKDTKAVNAFVAIVVIFIAVDIPLWAAFTAKDWDIGAHVVLCIAFISIAALCQLLLFLPKTLSLYWTRKKRQSYHTTHSSHVQ